MQTTNYSTYSIRNLLRVCLCVLLIKTAFSPRCEAQRYLIRFIVKKTLPMYLITKISKEKVRGISESSTSNPS